MSVDQLPSGAKQNGEQTSRCMAQKVKVRLRELDTGFTKKKCGLSHQLVPACKFSNAHMGVMQRFCTSVLFHSIGILFDFYE